MKKRMNEKKKAIILAVIGTVFAVVLATLALYKEVIPTIENSKESNKIVKNFYEKFESEERQLIYYAKEECDYCKLQTPILEEIAKEYDLKYYYIDSDKLTKSDVKRITEELDIENKTPTTIVVEDGEVVDTLVGYVEGSKYTEFLKETEILDEDAAYPGEKAISFIDYSMYEQLIASEETHVITIGQTGCSHCTAIKPVLNQVALDYDITINYLNLSEMTEEENNLLIESLEKINYDDEDFVNRGSFGTPLTLVVKNGKVIRYASGERTPSSLVRELKKAGVIKE